MTRLLVYPRLKLVTIPSAVAGMLSKLVWKVLKPLAHVKPVSKAGQPMLSYGLTYRDRRVKVK